MVRLNWLGRISERGIVPLVIGFRDNQSGFDAVIICSCNVISDNEVRAAAADFDAPRMSEVYRRLGRVPECGRCKRSVREIVHDLQQRA